jgi:hypothetical protein
MSMPQILSNGLLLLCAVQSALKSRFDPELSLFLQLTLYRLSVWATGASYGAKLQDLKYVVPSSTAADGSVLCACDFFHFLPSSPLCVFET